MSPIALFILAFLLAPILWVFAPNHDRRSKQREHDRLLKRQRDAAKRR